MSLDTSVYITKDEFDEHKNTFQGFSSCTSRDHPPQLLMQIQSLSIISRPETTQLTKELQRLLLAGFLWVKSEQIELKTPTSPDRCMRRWLSVGLAKCQSGNAFWSHLPSNWALTHFSTASVNEECVNHNCFRDALEFPETSADDSEKRLSFWFCSNNDCVVFFVT